MLHIQKNTVDLVWDFIFVKKIIDLMGGEIWFTSVLGEGTKFSFTAKFDKTSEDINKNKQIIEAESKDKEFKILLVEDDNINKIYFVKLLKKKGYVCDVCR